MRRLLALITLLLGVLASSSAAPVSAASCSGFAVDGLEITSLKATGLSCADARRVARAWVRSEDCNPTIGGPEECTTRRYRCRSTEGPGFKTTIACRRSGRRVGFRVGPA